MNWNLKKWMLASFALPAFFLAVSASGEEKIFFAKLSAPKVTAHVDEKNAPPPEGNKVVITGKGLEMTYNFTTGGHDALMAEFSVNISEFDDFQTLITAENPGMRPFIVFTDAGNEKHYYSMKHHNQFRNQALKKGKQLLKSFVLHKNKHKGEYFGFRWGGDDNQTLDFPIKKITIGINDFPDSFTGKGKIIFHSISFMAKKEGK